MNEEKQIVVDNRVFKYNKNGFFEVDKPYKIDNREWAFNSEHYNMSVLCLYEDGVFYVKYLSNDIKTDDALFAFRMKEEKRGVNYAMVSGLSESKDILMIGEQL